MQVTEPTTELYFESHITLSPLFGEGLERVKEIVGQYGFKVADLLMLKRGKDTPERSKFDTFCTTRGTKYGDILKRTKDCVRHLEKEQILVWRHKIENTLLDVRTK